MSLSSSTLSLKFMQRGLARSAPSPSSRTNPQQDQPSTPGTISAPAASSTPTAGPSRTTPHSIVTTRGEPLVSGETPLSRTEEEARWFMPKRSSGSGTSKSESRGAATRNGPTISFEQSYLPFLVKSHTLEEEDDEGDEDHPIASTKATGGGGRMTFGATTNPESDEQNEYGSSDEEDVDMDEDVTDTRQRRGAVERKSHAVSPPQPTPTRPKDRKFQRPGLSPPPQSSPSIPLSSSSRPKPTSQSSNTQPRTSIADKMRQTISARSGAPAASSAPGVTPVAVSDRSTPSSLTENKFVDGESLKKSKKKRAASSDAHLQRPSLPNLTSSEAIAVSSSKRSKISPSTNPSASSAGPQNAQQSKKNKNKRSQAPTLDEREAQMKAAKKAEKRLKAKAKA